MRKLPPIRIKRPKVRDDLMVTLITGATKGGVHNDRKKEEDRRKCRRKTEEETP